MIGGRCNGCKYQECKVQCLLLWHWRDVSLELQGRCCGWYDVLIIGFGLRHRAVCKVEELFVYKENKDKFSKPLKRKIFHEGIQQLEQELKSDKGKEATLEDVKELKGNFC